MARNKKKIIRAATVSLSVDFFKDIMLRMREDGYEMEALTSPGEDLWKLRDENGFKIFEVHMERRMAPFKDLKSLITLIKVFAKEKPQVVHSMTPKAGLLCMLASWLTRVPVRVHTFTGLVWPTEKGLKRRILMATDWITCSCATHVVPEGQGVMDDLHNYITNKPMKVLGYGNVMGVDMERFDPKRFDIKKNVNDPFTFTFVGRVVGDKGINELVEAFCKLNKKYPNTKLKLIGGYERELDPLLPDVDDAIQHNDAIEANGPCYGEDLLVEYLKADCHVMPSYREGFPNSVLEAGAMGRSQIVTDINGSREIITGVVKTEGEMKICKNGIIVPSKDTDNLYKAMEMILTDVDMRKSMETEARHSIMSRFEKGFVQSCLIAFYKEIMN